MFSVHGSLCSWPILEFGTEEQKQKYLVPLAQGEKLGAMGLTEPGAGTDANGVRTTAELKGDKYILNGTKIFITNGYYADTYVIFARTNPDLSVGHKGLSAFIVEKGFKGFSFGTKEKKMGIRASATYELVFDNCEVPAENLLGKGRRRLQDRYDAAGWRPYRRSCSGSGYCSGCYRRVHPPT